MISYDKSVYMQSTISKKDNTVLRHVKDQTTNKYYNPTQNTNFKPRFSKMNNQFIWSNYKDGA